MTNKENNFAKDINAPSKEQIMIDGCNVSGCEYACNTAFGKNGCKHPVMKNIYCFKNPNCDFKQLARKTSECEELKKQLKTSEKWRINAESLNEKFDIKNTRYRKALEEIEEVWEKDKDGDYDFVKRQILDIINKAKGERNV